ncbi:class A beta-lactamase-related serine hydrolase [Actinomadura darangshiensis]|uniref:Class A beta-lactamase-related serine hydrolase n=1 Tax=Actinomadura darangshiensis TaxID=705336 RepID=A0A4R4ZUU1_9ACTN|nr:serine hydrolase domain-containing protein [Actinomadura darangshiensis]TDD62931.1 class A beta-lactamase-related serine hydrolase [Actinomadura darangshiensis]
MGSDSVGGIDRRRLLGRGGLAAAGAVAAGGSLVGAQPGRADSAPTGSDIPPDTRPGGAYDRYVAQLAAEDKFSGVVLLAHKGRTVLSRSYGMADKEKGIRNHEGVAVNLSSGIQPFLSVAVLQLAQQGKLGLADTVGTHLTGFAEDIAEQVTIHHLLTTTSGMSAPELDLQRIFHSKEEVHEFNRQWTRQAELAAPPGTGNQAHTNGAGAGLATAAQIVEAVTGTTYWDYVHEHVFGRCGMTGTAFYTRPQWLTDEHIAHSYMRQADGSRVDAVRNLDKGSLTPQIAGKNPGRAFIGYATDDGFATAPDLVRFANALHDGTVLDRPFADLLTGAKIPRGSGRDGSPLAHPSFTGYTGPIKIIDGQWLFGRGGGTGGSTANWNIYPDTGWVGVILSNYDDVPIQDITQQELKAITGQG